MSVSGGDQSSVDYESVKDMKYMDAVLNEVLRLYPLSTFTERKVSKTYDMNGILLPVGLHIFVPIQVIHHDEKNHPNPETFDPERFMPDRIGDMDPFTFLGFGYGQRSCPGNRFAILEAKVALASIMLRFEFTKVEDGPALIDVTETVDELLATEDILVSFKKRK